jgi:predicted permease
MTEPLLRLLPVFAMFVGGIVTRRLGLLEPRHADKILGIVVAVGLPALILAIVSRVALTREDVWLPTSALLTTLLTWPLAWLVGRRLALPGATLGVFIVGPMILNLAAVYPFAMAFLGERGLAEIVLFDFGGLLVTLTLTYGIACRYGEGAIAGTWHRTLAQFARFPPFWALVVALIINFSGHALPEIVVTPLHAVGEVALWLIMFALGIYFRWRTTHAAALMPAIVLRGGLGFLLGGLWVTVFDLTGTTRAVVLAACAAPVGFNTVVFAASAGLDREFAAALASISLLLALIYLPILMAWH